MAKVIFLAFLRILMLLLCAGWVSLWFLKPTEFWTRKWHGAEASARSTIFGYSGLNFAVYTFPIIALAITGLVYLDMKPRETRSRRKRIPSRSFSNPLIISSPLGTVTSLEIFAIFLFILFLTWTFYSHISNDFKKMTPVKSLKLNAWQYKFFRVATRFGLLAEACLAFLLYPILRGLSLFRLLGIQFEASVRYHTWLGTAMLLFATFHGASTLFIWGIGNGMENIWKWQKTGRIYLAGEIALVAGLVIWVTSLPQIRRRGFEIFYYTHHLYLVFLVFFLFHCGDRHFYMIFAGVFLFGLDKLLRIIQSRPTTCLLTARLFPCNSIELTLPKDKRLEYNPTSVIFVKIPSISNFQWHPFSITSSSRVEDQTMSILIKHDGQWTRSLHELIQDGMDSDSDGMKCIPVAIEGPYGPPSLDFLRYDSLLLVAGGIGITPMLGILQEIAASQSSGRLRLSTRIQLVYIMKKSQDICLLNPVSPLIFNQPAKQWNLKLKAFVTRENRTGVALKELLREVVSQVQVVNFDTSCGSSAIFGLESLSWMAILAAFASILFMVILICLNHAFLPTEKKVSKEKNPTSIVDLLLICSFVIALIFSASVATVLRWRRLRKAIPPLSVTPAKAMELNKFSARDVLDEHEIHFGTRPNFREILSDFSKETTGSDSTGVLVCGPETMKESVAMCCRQNSDLKMGSVKKKPGFDFHSLSFTF